ncbi:hypothetical protein EYF80_026281 [Liparis tanakae]|uniref:Uncharacterized protein n=1 Tax=Liparis tanakae TaxID=230148 RepID=A0A4Z2HCS1_9TELE|nr:hypothetical protein EYF80_026281 [Liparis tanakae]
MNSQLYLVQADPIPGGGHEVLLDGVVKECVLVGAPRSQRRHVDQRGVKALPHLRKGAEL